MPLPIGNALERFMTDMTNGLSVEPLAKRHNMTVPQATNLWDELATIEQKKQRYARLKGVKQWTF